MNQKGEKRHRPGVEGFFALEGLEAFSETVVKASRPDASDDTSEDIRTYGGYRIRQACEPWRMHPRDTLAHIWTPRCIRGYRAVLRPWDGPGF